MSAGTDYVAKAVSRARRLAWRARPPQPTARSVVHCEGPSWFRRLVADEFELVDRGNDDLVRVVWDSTASTGLRADGTLVVGDPFVSPTRSHPRSLRRLPRGCPPEFARLDAAARRETVGQGPSAQGWVEAQRAAQLAYRAAHARSLRSLANEILDPAESSTPTVDVVCVSRRPQQVAAVINQFDAQSYDRRRLTIILTSADGFRLDDGHSNRWPHVTIETRPGISLGRCLNEFLEHSTATLVAKWDEDDQYGTHYLTDLMLTRNATGAAITGKHSYFAYLAHSNRAVVRFHGVSFCDTAFVAGGTLLLDRAALGTTRFPDVNLAEDGALLRESERRGLRIYAADPFNYVQYRGDANTWQIDDATYATGALDLGLGSNSGAFV